MSIWEPPRITDILRLTPEAEEKVRNLIAAMTDRGFDPVLFETLRTTERQRWLYGVGRTHDMARKPVTWTLHSEHLKGDAADIISRSRRWDYPAFFSALKEEAAKCGLFTIPQESCHCQLSKP